MTVTPEFKEATSRAALRALRGLEQTAVMLEKWGPEAFPANEQGQVHFGRAMTDSAAEAIRAAWRNAIVEVEHFPDDPTNLIEQRGQLRQALLEIAVELEGATREGLTQEQAVCGRISEALRIAKDALGTELLG